MKNNFYVIHLYTDIAIEHMDYKGVFTTTNFRTYVNTVNGDRLVVHDGNAFNGSGWFLYASDTLVCCGDVKSLHAERQQSDSEYNSFTFNYTEKRSITVS